MKVTVELILLVMLLCVDAVTAASEIAIIASSRLKLKRMASGGSSVARTILGILDNPERFFSTILVANNIVCTLIAIIVMSMVVHFMKGETNIGTLIATFIASSMIIVTEVTVKTLAARRSEKMAYRLAGPIKTLILIFNPVVVILEKTVRAITKLLVGKVEGKPSLVTEEEIRSLIRIGGEAGVLHKEQYSMLSKVFDFSDVIVKDVMTPRKDMVSIDIDSSHEDMMDKALECGYSRIPIHKGSQDNIVGIINMKDLLNLEHNKGLLVLQDIIYSASMVPESKKVAELLKEFQKGHTHIAIVTGPDGKITGLITLEDLLEEIVGEIEDEYDIRSKSIKKSAK
jgi:CBS domain containing-hemolysin-like protein